MTELAENGIARLVTNLAVNMETSVTKVVLYTVPTGKRAIITSVIIADPSGTLAGCIDVDFGGGTSATTWRQTVTGIADMTATDDYYVLTSDNEEYSIIDGDAAALVDRQFGMMKVDGADAANTVTIHIFGFLVNS